MGAILVIIGTIMPIAEKPRVQYNESMIKTYRNVLENPQDIIERSKKLFSSRVEHQIRICDGTVISPIMVRDEVILALPELIRGYADEYLQSQGISDYEMEDVQIIHYKKGEGFFGKHQDGLGRILSAILYLNAVEEGGETIFYLTDMVYTVKPEAGKLIFFGADVEHEATVPLSGDKHILVTWFRPV
jgi:hypothetical protein